MKTISYKGFVISHRKKPWLLTSGCDYDWHFITSEDEVFWKYGPSLQAVMNDIDQHLLDLAFCTFDTLESEGSDFENLN